MPAASLTLCLVSVVGLWKARLSLGLHPASTPKGPQYKAFFVSSAAAAALLLDTTLSAVFSPACCVHSAGICTHAHIGRHAPGLSLTLGLQHFLGV